MTREDEIALWRASGQDEVDSAHVYRALAAHSADEGLYARLAETEERHAALCAERLSALDAAVEDVVPTRRARILGFLGRRFGARSSARL